MARPVPPLSSPALLRLQRFIVDAEGRRSRQIDIAIYDRLYSPLLFPDESVLHVPAEAIYAVLEVNHELTSKWVADAGRHLVNSRDLTDSTAKLETYLRQPAAKRRERTVIEMPAGKEPGKESLRSRGRKAAND